MKRCTRVDELVQYWIDICGRFGISDSVQRRWWEAVVARYNEPQRAYHTMRHIQELRYNMLTIEDRLANPALVGFTMFFHDIIYDPTAKDNEERSVDELRKFSDECEGRLRPEFVDKAAAYIAQTKHHMSVRSDADEDLLYFLDLDLGILAADRERYGEYMKQIREEYSHVPADAYRAGRTQVLTTFLSTNPIYKTAHFRGLWEERAKINLQWEIAVLRATSLRSRKMTIGDKAAAISFERRERMKDVFTQMKDEEIEHAIAMNYNLCLCCRDTESGQLIAQVLTTRTTDERCSIEARLANDIMGDHLLIHSIAVAKDFRRRGIGTSLLKELLDAAEQGDLGIGRISLICAKGLVPFFEASGFKVVDSEVLFLQGAGGGSKAATGTFGAGGTSGSQASHGGRFSPSGTFGDAATFLPSVAMESSLSEMPSNIAVVVAKAAASLAAPVGHGGAGGRSSPTSVGDGSSSPGSRGTTPPATTPTGAQSRSYMPKHAVMVEMSRAVARQ